MKIIKTTKASKFLLLIYILLDFEKTLVKLINRRFKNSKVRNEVHNEKA
jgi:hypothetical protein